MSGIGLAASSNRCTPPFLLVRCCTHACKGGRPCSSNKHPTPIKPDATLYASCANPRYPCEAFWSLTGVNVEVQADREGQVKTHNVMA